VSYKPISAQTQPVATPAQPVSAPQSIQTFASLKQAVASGNMRASEAAMIAYKQGIDGDPKEFSEAERRNTVQSQIDAYRQRRIDAALERNKMWTDRAINRPNWSGFKTQPAGSGTRGYKWVRNFYGNDGSWYGLFQSNLGNRTKLWDIGMEEFRDDKRELAVKCFSCGKTFHAVIPGHIRCTQCGTEQDRS